MIKVFVFYTSRYLRLFYISFFFLCSVNGMSAVDWVVNPDHSEIFFQVDYLKISKVTGQFTDFKGEVVWEVSEKLPSEFNINIKTSSLFTGNSIRDGHLKGSAFFNIQQYPTINFKAEHFKVLVDNKLNIEGELTIKKRIKKINFEAKISERILDTWNHPNIFVDFKGHLSRRDFNILWNKSLKGDELLIGDNITVFGTLQLQPKNNITPKSRHRLPDNNSMRIIEQKMRGELIPFNAQEKKLSKNISVTKKVQETTDERVEAVRDFRHKKSKERKIEDISEKKYNFYLSFLFLSGLGFLAIIQNFFMIKKMILNYAQDRYTETRFWGLLGDLLGIFLTLLYAMAVYHVGVFL